LQQKLSYLWNEPGATAGYTTGVSLHGHTHFSRECLAFIAAIGKKLPGVRWAMQRERERADRGGLAIDFTRAYWRPPLAPRAAYRLESEQITEKLQLNALVSLTDHENIGAATRLRVLPESAEAPISIEWSVPYGMETEIHLGIHNLPQRDAYSLVKSMNEGTRQFSHERFAELLAALHALPEVLIVLHHPMWDLRRIGQKRLRRLLASFMESCGKCVHAVELGGLRSWDENQRALDFASQVGLPVISGGDRHGCEPNACVNLSNAADFAEFAAEVRAGHSHVLFMPQYSEPLTVRYFRAVNDIVGTYPDNSVGARWDDRVYHPNREGVEQSISKLWAKPPVYVGMVFAIFRLLETRPMMRLAQSLGRPEQPFEFTWTGEA